MSDTAEYLRTQIKACHQVAAKDAAEIASLRTQLAEAKAERDETYIDDDGNAWGRPTAWAYYSACKSMQRLRDRLAAESAARLQAEQERDEAKRTLALAENFELRKLAAAEQEIANLKQSYQSAVNERVQVEQTLERLIAKLDAALLAPQQEEDRGDGS